MSDAPPPGVSSEPSSNLAARSAAGATPGRSKGMIVGILILIALIVAGAFFFHERAQSAAGSASLGKGGSRGGGPTMISTITAQTGSMGVYIDGARHGHAGLYRICGGPRGWTNQRSELQGKGNMSAQATPEADIDPRPYKAAVIQAQGQLQHDKALSRGRRGLTWDATKKRYPATPSRSRNMPRTQEAALQEDEGTVEVDQGKPLGSAKVNLDYCHITSPIDGRVGLRLVDPGNLVQANGTTPLVIIAQLQPITVIFTVAEDNLPTIIAAMNKEKQLVMDVYGRDDQTRIATGKLETLDNEINTSTGTLRLRGVCSNEDESLFPNQFVNVRLLVNTLSNITLLPNSVIQRNSDTAFVYLVKPLENGQTNQTVQMQTITAGETDGTNSQVEGVSPGAVVAADNFNRLTDGATVTLRPAGGQGQRKGHKQNSQ